ncbi:hypothetical protein, partial [Bacteroides uniformis]|uniref:hypothetical protein n=1 Tax=Bacteroides uniformis TaxID=820 RepID=UPI001C11C6B7
YTYIRNHNRNAYGRTRNVRNGNRCTSGQAIGHRTARGGILLVIFPYFLLFCLRFWIGRGRQKLPFLFPFGWKEGYSVFIIKEVYFL